MPPPLINGGRAPAPQRSELVAMMSNTRGGYFIRPID
jgi:hypothetical protein